MTSVENDQKREAINSPEKAKAAKVARKEAAVKTSEENIPECPKDVGPGKVRCWDLQGSGDCGFRAICAAYALKHKGKPEEIQAKISKLAVSLRAKACIWLRQEQSWRETWFPDPEMTNTTEGGTIPSDLLSYLNVISRESKWMDPWLCHAVCNVILQDVIVFKYSKKKWVFLDRYKPDKQAASRTPIGLFLRDGHFTTLHPDEKFPTAWFNLGKMSTMLIGSNGPG